MVKLSTDSLSKAFRNFLNYTKTVINVSAVYDRFLFSSAHNFVFNLAYIDVHGAAKIPEHSSQPLSYRP